MALAPVARCVALELKWFPLCRDTVHYLQQDCIKRERGRAEWNSSCWTNTRSHTDAEQKHSVENAKESRNCWGQGVPLAMCKADQLYANAPASWASPAGQRSRGARSPTNSPTYCTQTCTQRLLVTPAGSCWDLTAAERWAANDVRPFAAVSSGSHLTQRGSRFKIVCLWVRIYELKWFWMLRSLWSKTFIFCSMKEIWTAVIVLLLC